MKKLIYIGVSILLLIVLTSCANNIKLSDQQQEPKMLDVALSVKPGKVNVNQLVTFEAKVTEGKERVNDADEVVFEIWRSKAETHDKFTIKHPKNGIYSLKKTFNEEGTYYIISHVTARGMHNMPKKEFVIGTASEREDPNAKSSMEGMNMDGQNSEDKKSENGK